MKTKVLGVLSALVLLLLTQACTRHLDPEEPCGFVQSSQMQRVSWKDNLPIKFLVHNSVPTGAHGAIEAAVKHWNAKLGKEAFRVEIWGVGGPTAPAQDFNNIIYWLENDWEQDRATQQARTTIYWTGSKIYEGDCLSKKLFASENFERTHRALQGLNDGYTPG